MFEPSAVYLFRGTTVGWPGNSNAVQSSLTYTSLHPVVATLFAVEARNHGHAVLIASWRGEFPEVDPGPFDVGFQRLELSVTLSVTPAHFAQNAELVFDVDHALQTLAAVGYSGIDHRLSGKDALQKALSTGNWRLDHEQIRRFVSIMRGEHR